MKSLFTFCLAMFVCCGITNAQTMIYSQNFESTYPEWTLNSTVSIAGTSGTNNAPSGNEWLINNIYAAGPFGTATPQETAGIISEPTSNYLHMNCGTMYSTDFGSNDNYLANGSGEVYIAQMTTPQSTLGYTNVYFSFWWLCKGDATGDEGKVYYSTDGGSTWTQITGTNFYTTTAWSLDSLHLAAFDNQASIEFAFTFTDANTGAHDPEFAIDDISLYGTSGGSVTPPVSSFTTTAETACQDSCLTFTNTSTGTIDSVRWTATNGATITSPTSTTSTSICFPNSGNVTVHLYAYNSGGEDSASTTLIVNAALNPVINRSGHTLSVANTYSSYQWYDGGTAISGATTSIYTYTVSGAYSIQVDSTGGCPGSSAILNTTAVTNVNNVAANFWLAQPNNSSISVNSSKPLDDNLSIIIYDATGRKILDEVWDAGSYTKQMDGLSVASGLYMIRLSNSYTSAMLKWLKP